MLIKLVFMQPPQRLKTLTAVAQEKKFPIVLLLVSLPGCYAGTQHQQRRAAFFGKTNSCEIVFIGIKVIIVLHNFKT